LNRCTATVSVPLLLPVRTCRFWVSPFLRYLPFSAFTCLPVLPAAPFLPAACRRFTVLRFRTIVHRRLNRCTVSDATCRYLPFRLPFCLIPPYWFFSPPCVLPDFCLLFWIRSA